MKKILILTVSLILLAGCATGPDKAALAARKQATDPLTKVEILYNAPEELVVLDGGGSGAAGFSALLGPVGMLIALGVNAGSKLSAAERAEARSKEFTAAVRKSVAAQEMNQQFAQALAARIRASGREVKLTPTKRANGPLPDIKVPEVQQAADYAPLMVRITTGYGAKDSTSAFRPLVTIEYVLKKSDQSTVHQSTFSSASGEPSYM